MTPIASRNGRGTDPARHVRPAGPERFTRHPGIALIVSLAVLAALVYLAFVRTNPFQRQFTVSGLVSSSEGLIPSAPVREAGIGVGQVTSLARGPGDTARVTMQIDSSGLPLHADATLRVRPRVFLEGGFYVDLQPGTPSAPTLHSGATIPLAQTLVAVQADQLYSAFPSKVRASEATVLHELSSSLSGGGADALRAIAQELPGTFKQSAIAARAWQGTAPGDLEHLIQNAGAVDATLAAQRPQLHGLIVDGERTWRVLAAHATDLQGTISSFDQLLADLPPTLRAVNTALPPVRTFFDTSRPAFGLLPHSLSSSVTVLDDLLSLSQPQRLPRLLTALAPVLHALPQLEGRLIPMFHLVTPVSRCVASTISPVLNAKLNDGNLSTNRPVWQDLLHTAPGLAGAAQNFDGNGGYYRFEGGGSDQYVTFGDIPGLGPALATTGLPLLGVRPHWNGPTPPPLRPDVPCPSQPPPSLQVPPWKAEPSQTVPQPALLTPQERAGALRELRRPAQGARR